MLSGAFRMGIVDGPTEVHRAVLGRQVLKRTPPAPGRFPTDHIPELLRRSIEKYGDLRDG